MSVKGSVNNPKMFATRISEASIKKARMLSRVKGVSMGDVFDLIITAYEPSAAEADAIRALTKADKESAK